VVVVVVVIERIITKVDMMIRRSPFDGRGRERERSYKMVQLLIWRRERKVGWLGLTTKWCNYQSCPSYRLFVVLFELFESLLQFHERPLPHYDVP
jgi:hypothetical protein